MSNEYDESLNAYLSKLEKCFTPSGGPIGDEWIYEKDVSSSFTGYEYCSIQEAMDSYITLFRYSKNKAYADKAEWIFNNAAFGSKSKELKAITYLNTDNSYQLDGTRPDEDEHQTRYRFSATHKEAAVCCVPNAGRVIPYYMHNMWLLEENVLYKTFYGPSCFETVVNDKKITIEEETSYPYSNRVVFKVASVGIDLDIKFRIPSHSKGVLVILDNKKIKLDVIDGFVTIPNHWTSNTVEFVFDFKLQMKKDNDRDLYFTYGPLLFALPVDYVEHVTKVYKNKSFKDYSHMPLNKFTPYLINKKGITLSDLKLGFLKEDMTLILRVSLYNDVSKKYEVKELIPFRDTLLRQTTFKQMKVMK
jgi:DUF1680 family protein